MKTSDFYYDLPQEQIAQTPIEPRDHSRLMVLHRENDEIEHRHFYDILEYLNQIQKTKLTLMLTEKYVYVVLL